MWTLEFGIPGEAYWPVWPFAFAIAGGALAVGYLILAERRGWWPCR